MAFEQSEIERFENVKKKLNDLSNKKIRIEERLSNEKSALEGLLAEITGKGYDPKNLAATRQEKQNEVNELLKKLETGVEEAEKKLQSIEV